MEKERELLKKAEKILGYIWTCEMEGRKLKETDLIAIEELGTSIAYHLGIEEVKGD